MEADKAALTSSNGGQSKSPFKLERSLWGAAQGLMEIAERCVNGQLGTDEANAATRALNGVPVAVRVELDALRLMEKGSEQARTRAARILDLKPVNQIEAPVKPS
jgi:hypothetical protein